MGTEDLFHKRKAKKASVLERRAAKRAPYEKVLIVCEGEKTEPNYFNEAIQCYRLNTANVEIDGSCGSSPISVFNRAKQLWEAEEKKGDPYDRIYCVFDRDSHDTYEQAISRISSKEHKNVFYAATSVPCFEYWLLLHFSFTTKPYAATGKLSIADTVIKELEQFYPEYTKGREKVFSDLLPNIEFAKNNAERALKQSLENHTDNPSTHIHELIGYLQNLKSGR
ncbi:RloB family protein [Teredinibacter turnerae]|uniref:RloB family protein n=1 Tax=Teredinibacter turnerae TaxID=2426 RepID=UPI0003697749|nr:RloB family protein [Teredinibacter turnerae]